VSRESGRNKNTMKPRIVAMLRIKNEERWIERCLTSFLDLVDGIVILDDGSADRTPEIARSFPKVLRYEYLKNTNVDEVRDKNLLLSWTLEHQPDWILAMDGDEELGSKSEKHIYTEIGKINYHNPQYAVLSFKHIYFWDTVDTYRPDGPYADIWRPRLFTTWNQDLPSLRFEYHKDHGAGFHCGSVPRGIIGRVKKIGVALKHYGYLDPELRMKKYHFYRKNDPDAYTRGYYEHLIDGNARLERWRDEIDEKNLAWEASEYGRFAIDPQGVHQMAVEMAENSARVMDVGCGAGHVGSQLKKRGCHVVGVEPDPQAATLARAVLDEVIPERAESFHRKELVNTFDTIMLLDTLEHVPEPLLVLTNLRKYLGDGGKFIISVPNAAHWTVRKMVVRGSFCYEDYGILDRNHLRFFTWASLTTLLDEARLRVTEVRYAFWLDSHNYHRWYFAPLTRLRLLKPTIRKLGPRFPRLFAFQFLVKAVPQAR